ncbi:hypothetical protein EXIGLDRAFT_834285 [Exidia glandulosa HHB12029]|uniref:AAA-ATPase-like domain-containing protein n=1 Tax=Exidia glandulosa HHB12029 TaxID=1314781 RepID=A0A165JX31_EXIGL|nr:hypothetical protein EXIGLDRAFT_834285 [Exidia glandulosa HHB12029]
MSVIPPLLCGILGHDQDGFLITDMLEAEIGGFDEFIAPHLRTLGDLLGCLADAHDATCDCGAGLDREVVWLANLPFREDCNAALAWYVPKPEERLDLNLELKNMFPAPDLPLRTIHLMLKLKKELPNPAWRLSMGLRRLEGDLCRVAGSHDLSLPTNSDFVVIASTPGCFYIDRFDWIMQRFGEEPWSGPPTRFPVIRRPAGYGKTTFLSAFATFFDSTTDQRLFPDIRVRYQGLPPRMLVYWLDLKDLNLAPDMSDGDIRGECLRVMMQATQGFLARYAHKLQLPLPDMDGEREKMIPYGVARTWAMKNGYNIFIAIDNYTAPFMQFPRFHRDHLPFRRIERAIYAYMLAHILLDIKIGVITRGCIIGELFRLDRSLDVIPFFDYPPFAERMQDLTYSPECAHIVGFTRGDVEVLAKEFLPSDEDAQAAVLSVIGEEASYAPQNVLQVLRDSPAAVRI